MWSYVHNTASLCAVLAALSVSGGLFQTLLSAEVRTGVDIRPQPHSTDHLSTFPLPPNPHRQLSKATPHELIGSILGVSYALETFAKVLTPPLGGYLLEQRGPHTLGWTSVLFLLPCVVNVALETVRRGREPQVAVEKKVA